MLPAKTSAGSGLAAHLPATEASPQPEQSEKGPTGYRKSMVEQLIPLGDKEVNVGACPLVLRSGDRLQRVGGLSFRSDVARDKRVFTKT